MCLEIVWPVDSHQFQLGLFVILTFVIGNHQLPLGIQWAESGN